MNPSRKQRVQNRGTIFNAGTQKKTRETQKDKTKAPARLKALAEKWKKNELKQRPLGDLHTIAEGRSGGGDFGDDDPFNEGDAFGPRGAPERRSRDNRRRTESNS